MNPAVDTRRVRRLEDQLSSLSAESDKAVQNLEKAVAELTLRVVSLESMVSSSGKTFGATSAEL